MSNGEAKTCTKVCGSAHGLLECTLPFEHVTECKWRRKLHGHGCQICGSQCFLDRQESVDNANEPICARCGRTEWEYLVPRTGIAAEHPLIVTLAECQACGPVEPEILTLASWEICIDCRPIVGWAIKNAILDAIKDGRSNG